MKKFLWAPLAAMLLFPSLAWGETASTTTTLRPLGSTFYSNAWGSAEWSLRTSTEAPPEQAGLLPTQKITLQLPGSAKLHWQPGSVSCPDNKIGPPPVNISVPLEQIMKRCPEALLGNGSASFLLAGQNKPDIPSIQLRAPVLAFDGGRVGGNPRIKFWAFSYDTGVGIYTEGILQPSGRVEISLPVLSFDSAVNALGFSIPSKPQPFFVSAQNKTITLPAGRNKNFVRARCTDGSFPFEASFLLGQRTSDGAPSGPTEDVSAPAENISCTGSIAKASISRISVEGPAKVSKGASATYRVLVQNQGGLEAREVRVRVQGPGIRGASSKHTVTSRKKIAVRIRPTYRGSVRLRFSVSSSNAGSRTVQKTIRVS